MKDELKTLKDLAKPYTTNIGNWIRENELKAEAVKRAKNYLSKKEVEIERISRNENGENLQVSWRIIGDNAKYYAGLLFEIIDFYNLTEVDLK